MNAPKELFADNCLVRLKDENWLEKQRVAGKTNAGALLLLEQEVKNGTTKTLLELNQMAETFIYDNKCTPTFKNYRSFPAGVCCSAASKLVHGIPDSTKLEDGMKISFDLGCTFEGAISDSALTVIYGESSPAQTKLLNACEEALFKGISAIAIGKRLGCIGHAISNYAKNRGYGNIIQYGGHGLCWDFPHAPPFVSNKANIDEGIRIQKGLTLALEPMLVSGSTKTWTDPDGWTVWCESPIVSHFEHSIYVHSDHIEILTYRGNEAYLKSNRLFFN